MGKGGGEGGSSSSSRRRRLGAGSKEGRERGEEQGDESAAEEERDKSPLLQRKTGPDLPLHPLHPPPSQPLIPEGVE